MEKNNFMIFRSRDSGVMCGYLDDWSPAHPTIVRIREARQIWGWDKGANTLMEASNDGLPLDEVSGVRISKPNRMIVYMLDACTFYECTSKAQDNLSQSRWTK